MSFKDDWNDNKKTDYLNQNLLMSRKRFLLTNGVYAFIGFACYYIFLG